MKTSKKMELIECFFQFLEDLKEEVVENAVAVALQKIEGKQQPQKLFYNLEEVAHITGISRLALKGRIKRKTLIAVYDGNVILIPVDELNNLIKKLNVQQK